MTGSDCEHFTENSITSKIADQILKKFNTTRRNSLTSDDQNFIKILPKLGKLQVFKFGCSFLKHPVEEKNSNFLTIFFQNVCFWPRNSMS